MSDPKQVRSKTFLVRKSCEYSALVEADTASEAVKTAETLEQAEWEEAWSGIEVDTD